MKYRLKKANVERMADTEESKNYLMSLGYKIIESSKSEKTDEDVSDNSKVQNIFAEVADDKVEESAEIILRSKKDKTANKAE